MQQRVVFFSAPSGAMVQWSQWRTSVPIRWGRLWQGM